MSSRSVSCEGVESQARSLGGAVKIAPLPPRIIPQGIVTPGLLAHVFVAKFVHALPYYRQKSQFARLGIDISRATLCNQATLVSKAIEPLTELLLAEIRSGPIIEAEETRVQVLNEPGRADTSQSYVWVMLSGPPEAPAVPIHYAPDAAAR